MTQAEDSQFVRLFTIMIVVLVVFCIAMIFLGKGLGDAYGPRHGDGDVAARIAPVGAVNTGAPVAAEPAAAAVAAAAPPAAGGDDPGKAVYDGACFACHGNAAIGAPVLGNAQDWAPRIEKGLDTLVSHAIDGFQGEKGVMPPRGARTDLSDDDVRAAVQYMVRNSGGADAVAPATGGGGADSAAAQTPADTVAADTAAAADDAGAGNDTTLAEGKQVYDQACFICHASGAAGAPKLGDAEAWNARVAQGMDVLDDHAVNGYMGSKGLMPPRGGRADIADDKIKAAVAYMVDAVK
ncbi:MAG: cytochrome c5 family protein [Gammaproteobacteria bacterium]|nr:cytochrome c5 family protein [Gammaproteobacteria bacterium]